jgi:hypothetical protein
MPSSKFFFLFYRNLLQEDCNPLKLTKDAIEIQLSNIFPSATSVPVLDLVMKTGCSRSYEITEKASSNAAFLMEALVQKLDVIAAGLAADDLHFAHAPVYRRPDVGSMCTPVQHELLGVCLRESTAEFAAQVHKLIQSVFHSVTDVHVLKPEIFADHDGNFRECFSIDASYCSSEAFYTAACNHVNPTGPANAENSRNLSKCWKLSTTVAICGQIAQHLVFVLNIDSIAQILHKIPDQRLFLRENHSKLGLFPPMWRHDLSFWESVDETFDEKKLLDVVQSVTGDATKQVLLVNKWEEPGTGRMSRCYREIYQSSVHAISHAVAHSFQNAVRLAVRDILGVELR